MIKNRKPMQFKFFKCLKKQEKQAENSLNIIYIYIFNWIFYIYF